MKKSVLIFVSAIFAAGMISANVSALETGESMDDMVYLLSHLIAGEAEYCDKETKEWVGSVVINRVNSDQFPNTLYEVTYQPGQYACTWDGNFNIEPSQETVDIAKDLLENGSKIPENVVFQAEFLQGSGEWDHKVCPNGVTEYFCYETRY